MSIVWPLQQSADTKPQKKTDLSVFPVKICYVRDQKKAKEEEKERE